MEQNNGISLKAYRMLDLFIFSLLTCAVELVNIIVLNRFFSAELFTLSLVIPMSLISIQRWGIRAWMVPAVGGVAYCVANGAAFGSYVVYVIGNCFVLLNLFWYMKTGKKAIQESTGLKIAFALTGFFITEVGRTLLAALLERDGRSFLAVSTEIFRTIIVTDALNIVIGTIIILIAGRQNGLFMDQLEYLKELQAEKDKNKKDEFTFGGYDEEECFIENRKPENNEKQELDS